MDETLRNEDKTGINSRLAIAHCCESRAKSVHSASADDTDSGPLR